MSAFSSCGQAVVYAPAGCVPGGDSCSATNDVNNWTRLRDGLSVVEAVWKSKYPAAELGDLVCLFYRYRQIDGRGRHFHRPLLKRGSGPSVGGTSTVLPSTRGG